MQDLQNRLHELETQGQSGQQPSSSTFDNHHPPPPPFPPNEFLQQFSSAGQVSGDPDDPQTGGWSVESSPYYSTPYSSSPSLPSTGFEERGPLTIESLMAQWDRTSPLPYECRKFLYVTKHHAPSSISSDICSGQTYFIAIASRLGSIWISLD